MPTTVIVIGTPKSGALVTSAIDLSSPLVKNSVSLSACTMRHGMRSPISIPASSA